MHYYLSKSDSVVFYPRWSSMVNKNRNKRQGKKRNRQNAKNRNPGATDDQNHTQVRGWSQLVEGGLIWNSLLMYFGLIWTLISIQLVLLTKKVDILMNESCVPFLIA